MISPFRSLIFCFCLFFGRDLRAQEPKEVKFLAYNLENYVRMERVVPGEGKVDGAPKPPKDIAAVISIIAAEKPDIIGVCEMGAPAEFADFLARLKAVGLDFPHTEYVQALDLERHLAFASRFPISARNSQTNLSFDLAGKKQYYKRGILDVTVDVSEKYQLHFVGTHLKSRRDAVEDQAVLRRNEAHLLRLHARGILQKFPTEKLLVYGDLNDTIDSASVREIVGSRKSPDYLRPIVLHDANGEKWTHYWDTADIYSRIDYVLASKAVAKDVDREKSHLVNSSNWNIASDHRALVVVLKTSP